MFYKKFSEITHDLPEEFVEEFDYWLATLPQKNKKNITVSSVASRFQVKHAVASAILKYAEKLNILEKYYIIKCPDCDMILETVAVDDIYSVLMNPLYCDYCEQDIKVTNDDIYYAYKVIKNPDASSEEIEKEIERRLFLKFEENGNFQQADSLAKINTAPYEMFYNPSESAYAEFIELRNKLDLDYGKNRKAKGDALEKLILRIFKEIKFVSGTRTIKTETNQIDCTNFCSYNPEGIATYKYLVPYFLVECKNENTKNEQGAYTKKPGTTYCKKLLGIMEGNESHLGIIWARAEAARTCFRISRDHYLLTANMDKKILITFSDKDLSFIIDERVNLLDYLYYKICCITLDTQNFTYEEYVKEKNSQI